MRLLTPQCEWTHTWVMKRFTVILTEEQHGLLERLRGAYGLRSHADVVRLLIERGPGPERKKEALK